jgi:hypothetical protein
MIELEKASIYFENDYAIVRWDVSSKSIVLVWHKFAPSEKFRLVLDKLIEAMDHYKSGRILADTRNQGVITVVDQNWTNQDWYPRALNVGYCKIGVVLPKSIITQMSINRIMKETAHPELTENYFETLEEARTWLAE